MHFPRDITQLLIFFATLTFVIFLSTYILYKAGSNKKEAYRSRKYICRRHQLKASIEVAEHDLDQWLTEHAPHADISHAEAQELLLAILGRIQLLRLFNPDEVDMRQEKRLLKLLEEKEKI